MAGTVSPAGRGARASRWGKRVIAFGAGSAVGATLSGGVVALVVSSLDATLGQSAAVALVLCVAAYFIVRDAGLQLPIPYRAGQVPEWLRRTTTPTVSAGLYGAMLGVGFYTHYTVAAHPITLAAIALVSPLWAAAAIVIYAVAKTLVLITVSFDGPGLVAETERRRFRMRQGGSAAQRFASAVAVVPLLLSFTIF